MQMATNKETIEKGSRKVLGLDLGVGSIGWALIEEQDGQVYNIVTLWRDSLKKDENGKYVISTTTDMAVAIAYIAQIEGIEAPAPVGAYSKDFAVINL